MEKDSKRLRAFFGKPLDLSAYFLYIDRQDSPDLIAIQHLLHP
jgi:hypothetical protein